jgi:hypothetical protein
MDAVLGMRDAFVTKKVRNSFGGYAVSQIIKAKGQDKKQNWEKSRMERKTPLDFCYVLDTYSSVPLLEYAEKRGISLENVGLSKNSNARDTYAMFYDPKGEFNFSGICGENSNEVRLSSIPKEATHLYVANLTFNKDSYSSHCKDYNSYQEWLKKRNDARWIETQSHGQKIDGKNMMHCQRLLNMACEILEHGTITIRRPEAEYLLQIRRGEVDLQKLISDAEATILRLDELYKTSSLPEEVDPEFVSELLLAFRMEFYSLNFQPPYTT